MDKYNNHYFWEYVLSNGKDVFRGYFKEPTISTKGIFINSTVVDYGRNTLDNDWAFYPDIKSLLGFIQYVYIPQTFFYILNKTNKDIYVPICSSEKFIEYMEEEHFNSQYTESMKETILELSSCWDTDDDLCLHKIIKFCQNFNSIWNKDEFFLHLGIFTDAQNIAEHIIKNEGFIEILEEDFGISMNEFFKMCESFYEDKFMQKIFLQFLNNKVGCII